MNLIQATSEYINHINRLNDRLNFYAKTIEFKCIDLSEAVQLGELPSEVRDLENCIYYIQLENVSEEDVRNISKYISELKNTDKSTKYPKVNQFQKNPINTTLYIGKSKGKLKNRFRSHIKATPKTTFGLHLENWITNEQFKHIQLRLYYAEIHFINENNANEKEEILEMLESSLHLQAQPLLGRSGH